MEFGTVDLVIVALVLLALYIFNKKPANLPPGPRGVPIFGNLLTLRHDSDPSRLFYKWAKEYGPVMTLWLGSRSAVVLSGYDAIREGLVDKAEYFSGRPELVTHAEKGRSKGIFQGSDWKWKRRMMLVSMRDFGLGKKSLDERIYDEAGLLLAELDKKNGKNMSLQYLMPVVTANIICTIIRGERFEYDDPIMPDIIKCLLYLTKTSDFAAMYDYMPWVSYMPFSNSLTMKGEMNHIWFKFAGHITKWVEDHKATYEEDNIRDLIDLFLTEIKKNDSAKDDFILKEDNIAPLVLDLFVAGTETTSTTLQWCIAYLITHPDIQRKCHQEIHEVVGKGRIPQYSDAKNLPYTNAVLNETQRMGNVVPMAIAHCTVADVEIRGYTIPRNSIVYPNLESALKDEKYFGDAYTFRPERWLDADGKLIKSSAFIPFSLGKRECLGELLARKEVFIFAAAMLQNFTFEKVDPSQEIDLSKGCGKIRTAPEYEVRVNRI